MAKANKKPIENNPNLQYEVYGFRENGEDVNIPLSSIKNLIESSLNGVTNNFTLSETSVSDGAFTSNSLNFDNVTTLQFNNSNTEGLSYLEYFQLLDNNKDDIFLKLNKVGFEINAIFRITDVVFNNDGTTTFTVELYNSLKRGSFEMNTDYSIDFSVENYQPDYNQTDNTKGDYIKNKPVSHPKSFIDGLEDDLSNIESKRIEENNKITGTDEIDLSLLTTTNKLSIKDAINELDSDLDSKESALQAQINSNDSDISALQSNQNTGVASYTNLADLPVTGIANISYKVTNDSISSDNNGYYTWNGSVYVKDVELYATVFNALNNSDSATMMAMDNFIRKGYLWTFGNVTIDYTNNNLTITESLRYYTEDGFLFLIEGGSGIGGGMVTNFSFYDTGTINLIHIDIPIVPLTGTTTVTLTASPINAMPSIDPLNKRILLGTSYTAIDGKYSLLMQDVISQDLNRRLLTTESDVVTLTNINIPVISGTDSDFSGAGNWATGGGSPTFDINDTVAGKLYIGFTSGNQYIQLVNKLTIGKVYNVTIKARLNSGVGTNIRVGDFTTGLGEGAIEIVSTSTETTFTGQITATSTAIYIGVINADNNGSTFEFDDIQFSEIKITKDVALENNNLSKVNKAEIDLLKTTSSIIPQKLFKSLSKTDKVLTKICVAGDSLMANALGGTPPTLESVNQRPIRLSTNTIARRIYDLFSWNKPNHRSLLHSDFTKSGTWTSIDDTTVFEPASLTPYSESVTASAYVELAIPDGFENFAIICQKDTGFGNLNVTLNGGSIASYGSSVIACDRTRDSGSDIGNPFYTELYKALPSGVNTIRIAKDANTAKVRIWGVMYWTGNTMMVYNVGHGGHTITTLKDNHYQAEVVENNFDAILFEAPLMNEASQSTSTTDFTTNLTDLVDNYFTGKDLIIMSCNPFGDNGAGTNYYTTYSTPTMEALNTALRTYCVDNDIQFFDIFKYFKLKIENRGGTLNGGQGGLYYTGDGQHPNENGVNEWWNLILSFLNI